jgi:hypothetical protein
MDIQEYLLDQIVCLGFISKNSLANIPDGTSVASKEQGKSLTVARFEAFHQVFICGFK